MDLEALYSNPWCTNKSYNKYIQNSVFLSLWRKLKEKKIFALLYNLVVIHIILHYLTYCYIILSHYLTYCSISGSISLSHLLLYFRIHFTISLIVILYYLTISLSHVLLYFRIHFTISLIVIFQDPFGEKRGIYDYENIFKRLESIKKVLSEKHQSSEDTESSDTDLDISSTERWQQWKYYCADFIPDHPVTLRDDNNESINVQTLYPTIQLLTEMTTMKALMCRLYTTPSSYSQRWQQ